MKTLPDERLKQWQAPAFEEDPAVRQSWTEEAVQEGGGWWDAQPAAKSEQYLKLLGCDGAERLKTNSLSSDLRLFVETISDIREIATYGSGADQYKSIVEMYNKTLKWIFQASHFSRQERQSLQYGVAMGRGYIWPRYKRTQFGWGPGEFEFAALGPREVLPLQVPQNNDVQGCYGMTIVEPMGIAEAHARFPHAQEELLPISKQKYSSNAQVRRLEFWDRWRYGEKQKDWDQRYCEIRHTIVRDLRINRSGRLLQMGDFSDGKPTTSWSYEVPAVGSLISWTNSENGMPASRTARAEDCRVYPNLRQIITNPGMSKPLYDGPAFDSHGIMPAVQYDVDDWPWLSVGYSLLQNVAGIEQAQRGFIDLMYRVLKAKMRPIMGYDLNMGIPREDIKRLDILEDDINTIGVDGDPGKALKSLLPDSVKVDSDDFKMVEMFNQLRGKALGLNKLESLEKLKFNLSSETADKILETIGPIAKGIAGNMELAHGKIANMLKYMIPQYLTTRKLLSYIGPDAVSTLTFDLDPESLIPSHMPHEENLEKEGKASQVSRMERARWFPQNLEVISVPNSLLNVTQMQEQLKYMNALQRGWPISFSTAFKKMNIDWPETPGADEFDRYEFEQMKLLNLKIKASQVAAAEGVGGGEEGKGQGKGGGRKPTAKQAPKLEKRGNTTGNPRTVVSQSK